MDIQDLEYFISIAESLNFTRAAAKHHIAQTAISRHIMSLENELGVQLFYRNNRSVSLTPAGEVFLHEIRPLLNAYTVAVTKAQKASYSINDTISIGIGPYEKILMQRVISSFLVQLPDTTFNINQHGYGILAEGLLSGLFDVIFSTLRWPLSIPGCKYKVVESSKSTFVLSKQHPLLSSKASITVQDLESIPMAINLDTSSSYVTDVSKEMLDSLGVRPKKFHFVNSFDAKLTQVESCNMFAALPEFISKNYLDRFYILYTGKRMKYTAAIMKNNHNPAAQAFFNSIPYPEQHSDG